MHAQECSRVMIHYVFDIAITRAVVTWEWEQAGREQRRSGMSRHASNGVSGQAVGSEQADTSEKWGS
jgi:hypothetical protein